VIAHEDTEVEEYLFDIDKVTRIIDEYTEYVEQLAKGVKQQVNQAKKRTPL